MLERNFEHKVKVYIIEYLFFKPIMSMKQLNFSWIITIQEAKNP